MSQSITDLMMEQLEEGGGLPNYEAERISLVSTADNDDSTEVNIDAVGTEASVRIGSAGSVNVEAIGAVNISANGAGGTVGISADTGVTIESAVVGEVSGILLESLTAAISLRGLAIALVDDEDQARVLVSGVGVGFNGVGPSIPEIPAVPLPQDIVDALVALGLVTQAP